MIIGPKIYTILSEDSGVNDLVKENIRPGILPQNAGFPAIVYTEISIEPNDTKSGKSTNDRIDIQFDIYSSTYANAQNIASKVRDKLDRFSNTDFSQCVFQSQNDGPYEDEHEVFRITQQFEFRL